MNSSELEVHLESLTQEENSLEHYQANGSEIIKVIESFASEDQKKELISTAKAAEILAFYGREKETRSSINQDNPSLFQTLASCYQFEQIGSSESELQKDVISLKVQLLRAIGNLAIDDDEARQRFLNTGILPTLIKDFSVSEDPELAKVRTGCLLNTTLGFTPARKQVLEYSSIPALLSSISVNRLLSEQYMTVFLGLRFLSDIFEEDGGPKAFAAEFEYLDQIIKALGFYIENSGEFDIPIMEHLAEIIELTINENAELQPKLIELGGFDLLCDFLEKSNSIASRYPDEKKKLTAVCVVIERCIVLAASHDSNLALFDNNQFMKKMADWLKQTSDPQLVSCAALVIGNLARTDSNCIRLVQEYQLHITIIDVLSTSTDLSLLHAMVGVLKNLAIPVDNKSTLGKLGIIKLVAPLLEKQSAQPLQFGVASLLKHLANRNDHNAIAICSEENATNNILPITELRKIIQKSDNQGIRSEATRALMHVTKVIYSTPETYELYGKVLTDNTVLQPIIDLVRQTKYPVLQNEALVALTLLASSQRPDIKDIVDALEVPQNSSKEETDGVLTEADALETVPLFTALEDIALSSKRDYPPEMRQNVLMLLEQLLVFSKSQDPDIRDSIKEKLKPLLENMSKNKTSERVDSLCSNLLSTYM